MIFIMSSYLFLTPFIIYWNITNHSLITKTITHHQNNKERPGQKISRYTLAVAISPNTAQYAEGCCREGKEKMEILEPAYNLQEDRV